jgi:3-deoxy-manno-octulosonate cytidylyltransferase (CMP-KDO synthetase)
MNQAVELLKSPASLFFITGPCAMESRSFALETAEELKAIFDSAGLPFIYKSSFDKANRSSVKSFHGVGMEEGLSILAEVREKLGIPVLADVHESCQVKPEADLGVSLCRFGVKDKAAACREIIQAAGVGPSQTACVGDDSIDLPAFAVCGFSFAVADAPVYVKQAATETLSLRGGEGTFREVADKLLTAAGRADVFGSADGFSAVMNRMVQ